jgi:hypothetical protein
MLEVMTIHEYKETRTNPPGVEGAFRWYPPLLVMIARGKQENCNYNGKTAYHRRTFTRRKTSRPTMSCITIAMRICAL